MKITLVLSVVWNGAVFAVTPMITTIGVRLLFSILFAMVFHLGVIGVAAAMCLDWCIRAVIFYLRFQSGTWKQYQLIELENETEDEE